MDQQGFQRVRTNQFKKVYDRWKQKKLTQKEAGEQLGITERTLVRYRGEGTETWGRYQGAPQQETSEMVALYRDLYPQRNIAHFHEAYTGPQAFLQLGKEILYNAGVGRRPRGGGPHRQRRERKEQAGLMIIRTRARTSGFWGRSGTLWSRWMMRERYTVFFSAQEGTWSSFRGVRDVLESKGIFSSFYSDRGSHYWNTPVAGGRVDKENPTQFGRGISWVPIPGCSPEARKREDVRDFAGAAGAGTGHSGEEANRFLRDKFVPVNRRFMVAPAEEGSAFVPLRGGWYCV